MFKLLRQCRYLVPLGKSMPSTVRQLSTQGSFMVPTCSNIISVRFSKAKVMGPYAPPDKLTYKTVEERVIKAIKAWDRFPQDKIDSLTMDSKFIDELGWDSLDMVEVTMALEDEFKFEFPETQIDSFRTPRDIFKFICEHEDVRK